MSSESRPSRRDLFKAGLGLAIGGGLLYDGIKNDTDTHETEPHYDPHLVMAVRDAHLDKINFSGEHKELTTDVANFINEVVRWQTKLSSKISLGGESSVSMAEMNNAVDITDNDNRKLWKSAQQTFAGLPDYTQENFENFLIIRLPEILAQYGIFTSVNALPSVDTKNDTVSREDFLLYFYQGKSLKSDKFTTPKGEVIQRDVVSLGGSIEVDGKPIQTKRSIGSTGKTSHQTIFIDENAISVEVKEFSNAMETLAYNGGTAISDEKIHQILEKSVNQDKDTIVMLALKLARQCDIANLEADSQDRVISHETGHLISHKDKIFRDKTQKTPKNNSGSEYVQSMMSSAAHDEINGFIAELRFSRNKSLALVTFCNIFQENLGVDSYPHIRAGQWLQTNIVKLLLSNPDHYGIKIVPDHSITEKNQALLQLSVLVKNPEIVDRFCADLLNLHEKDYEADLGKEFVIPGVKGVESEKEEKPFLAQPYVHKYGGAAIITGTVALLLKSFFDRKDSVTVSSNRHKARSKKDTKRQ